MSIRTTPINSVAFWLILVGGMLCLIIPLLAPLLPIQYMEKYSGVGDAIGGISGPFAQILGSIILFLALKAQTDANGILHEQIEKENKKEQLRHELNQLHELYQFVERNIRSFSYDQTKLVDGRLERGLLYSRRAIKCFIEDLERLEIDIHNDGDVLMYDGVKEIMSILNSVELFLDKLEKSGIDDYHRGFYKTLMQHEILFSIFPYQELDDRAHLKTEPCEECGKYHANYPPLIYQRLQEIKARLFQAGLNAV